MKKITKKLLLISCLLCVGAGSAIGFSGCKDDEESSPSAPIVVELTLAQEEVELTLGDSYTVRATVEGSGEAVAFSSSDPTVATVDANGVVTTLKEGTAVITATVAGVSDTCTLTVIDKGYLPYITFEGVGTTEDFNLLVGDEFLLKGETWFRGNKVNESVSVSSDKPEVVKVENGKLVAVASGTATITATSTHLGKQAVKTFTVSVVRNIELGVAVSELSLATQPLFGAISEYDLEVSVKENGEALTGAEYTLSVKDTEVADMVGNKVVALGVGETAVVISCTVDGVEYTREIAVSVKNPKLSTVEDLEIVNGKLVWNEVEGADYYVVSDIDNEWEVTEESFDCNQFLGAKNFFITALSNEEYIDSSNAVKFSYTFQTRNVTEQLLATESMEASISAVSEDNATEDGAIYYVSVSQSALGGKEGDMVVRKIYFNSTAYGHYGNEWCKSAIFGMDENVAKYMGYQITFWAYAEEETTFKISYLKDGNWGRGTASSQSVPAKTWTKVSFTILDGMFPYLTWLASTGNFYACDFRVADAEYDGVDYSSLSWFTDKVNALIKTLPANEEDATVFDGAKVSEIEKYYALLTDTEKAKITGYEKVAQVKAAVDKEYVVLDGMLSTANYSVNGNLTLNKNIGLSTGYDETYGNYLVLKFKGSVPSDVHLVVNYNFGDDLATRLADCDKVIFHISTNGQNGTRELLNNFGGKLSIKYGDKCFTSGTWTKVEVPVADFLSGTYFGAHNVGYATEGAEYRISMIYAKKADSAEEQAQAVIDLIETLPEATAVEMLDGGKIKEANEAFNALSTEVQALVTNSAKLQDVVEAWDNKFVLLDASYSLHGSYTTGAQAALSNGVDETYGEYLNVKYTGASGEIHAVAKYAIEDLATKLNGFDTVVFYVWTNGVSRPLMCNFGGSLKINYGTIIQNAWTKVEVPVADFISGNYVGVLNAGYGTLGAEYKFTSFYGTNAETVEWDGVIDNMTTTSAFSNSSYTADGAVSYSVGTDATYGNYFCVTYDKTKAGTAECLGVKYSYSGLETKLASYDKVEFYVYNNTGVNRNFWSNFGQGNATPTNSGIALVAGEWTKIEVSVADFINGSCFGVFNALYGNSGSYYFSSFKAVKAEA